MPSHNTTRATATAAVQTSSDEKVTTIPAAAAATGAGVNTGGGSTRPKTEAELEADRLYEERMEEEYAKLFTMDWWCLHLNFWLVL
ncbi:hypothetical protein B0H66DRAFT_604420 [Apodospora peruviana]|uniref:Uncharacterized protein n=1 Tax=Apodospora peruviana TaxID=516989 RepID=A0AAE0I009_9PEZI|nr:hypothetical protein B0H66DRAFT_604420 [Apodospora peruviana]